MKKRTFLSAILGIAALVFAALAVKEYLPYWKNGLQTRRLRQEVIQAEGEESEDTIKKIDWEKLRKINGDVIGWIEVPGTKVDYPILKCPSFSYYLHYDIEKKQNILGSIFVQPETAEDFSDQHTIIYGHNMKDQQMFGSLHEYESEKFWKKHKKVLIYQPEKVIYATVYSTYDCFDATETYETEFSSAEEWQDWLNFTMENSYYDTEIEPEQSGQVFTLSTCSNRSGGRGRTSRYVVHCVATETVMLPQ